MRTGRGCSSDSEYGSHGQDSLPRCAGDLSQLGETIDQRNFAEPREDATEETGASHRHFEKGTDDSRIELSC